MLIRYFVSIRNGCFKTVRRVCTGQNPNSLLSKSKLRDELNNPRAALTPPGGNLIKVIVKNYPDVNSAITDLAMPCHLQL
jgi:hypothetical protein